MANLNNTTIDGTLTIMGEAVADFVVERGNKNGWNYVIYNSGWKECYYKFTGSSATNVSITLPIEFSNTNYSIQLLVQSSGSSGNAGFTGNWWGAWATSTTSINIDKSNANYGAWIEVKGY